MAAVRPCDHIRLVGSLRSGNATRPCVVLASEPARDGCQGGDAVPHADANQDIDGYGHGYSDTYLHANGHLHTYANRHRHTYANRDQHTHPNRDQHTYPNRDQHAHANSHAKSDAQPPAE